MSARRLLRPVKRLAHRVAGREANPRANLRVSGYASIPAVRAGEVLDLHLGARPAGSTQLRVERVGSIECATELTANLPRLHAPARAWEGYGWPVTTSFRIPPDWPSGLYGVLHDDVAVLSFVVLPARPAASARILCHVPILTAAAYEPAGGKSLYGYNSEPEGREIDRATSVSLHRPSLWDPLGYSETVRMSSLACWLDDEGIPVEYCSSVELDGCSDLLDNYDCLILPGHDEYWTRRMRDNAERFVASGGNLVVLSGNTCYRLVRMTGERVEFYKYASDDPCTDPGEVTVAWADPPVGRPQNTFIGAGCTHGAMEGEPSAYSVRFPGHWVFAGVEQSRCTSAFMTYETDAAAFVDEPEGYPRVTGEDATPLACTVLASADLRSWTGKPGRATMCTFSRHGTVFNAGTTEWIDALSEDALVAQVTRNVLARLHRRTTPSWEHIGSATGIVAMTAHCGLLLAATGDGRLVRRHPVGADVPWVAFGAISPVVAIAAQGDTLFALDAGNQLSCRSAMERDEPWLPIGSGPPDGTRVMAGMGGMLHTVGPDGALWQAPAERSGPVWRRSALEPLGPSCTALGALGGILVATTADGRLVRTSTDHISEGSVWSDAGPAVPAVGIGAVEWVLFAAGTDESLDRLDASVLGTRR